MSFSFFLFPSKTTATTTADHTKKNPPAAGVAAMLLAALLSNPLFYPIALAASAVGWVVHQRVYSPYAAIPGPFWASITRFWYLQRINAKDMHRCTKELHEKHGICADTERESEPD